MAVGSERILKEIQEMMQMCTSHQFPPGSSLDLVKKAVQTKQFLKKNLSFECDVPLSSNHHCRVSPQVHMIYDIPPSYPIMLPRITVQTIHFLKQNIEEEINKNLIEYISQKHKEDKQKPFLKLAMEKVRDCDYGTEVAKLNPRIPPSHTYSREYFFFHHLWGRGKRFCIRQWAVELNISGLVSSRF
eukprot:TRINITY_DN5439_c0_g1_i3.p1 TRINITY_DN5439_c0_g1~~TRINITY_DN5439_c0_g1_i3.p1  ORF type:complete len:187 (-),score=13.42 TRINITY_DN5439_c0_g1_i3:458-1018(-)